MSEEFEVWVPEVTAFAFIVTTLLLVELSYGSDLLSLLFTPFISYLICPDLCGCIPLIDSGANKLRFLFGVYA